MFVATPRNPLPLAARPTIASIRIANLWRRLQAALLRALAVPAA